MPSSTPGARSRRELVAKGAQGASGSTVIVTSVAPGSGESATPLDRLPGIVGTEFWASREIDAVMGSPAVSFTDRLLIVSLTKPFGNGLHRLLGRQGVTKEDLICLGCLRLRSYGKVRA